MEFTAGRAVEYVSWDGANSSSSADVWLVLLSDLCCDGFLKTRNRVHKLFAHRLWLMRDLGVLHDRLPTAGEQCRAKRRGCRCVA